MSRLSRKCGNLDVSQPYGTPRPVTGTALLYFDAIINTIPYYDGFEVLNYLTSKTAVSLVAMPCTSDIGRRFGGTYALSARPKNQMSKNIAYIAQIASYFCFFFALFFDPEY
jgi:hypothetical protein